MADYDFRTREEIAAREAEIRAWQEARALGFSRVPSYRIEEHIVVHTTCGTVVGFDHTTNHLNYCPAKESTP